MSQQYHIVPWYSSDEWHAAYRYIFSENSNKGKALDILQIWKARCPALPSGIESTLSLLQVQIQDEQWDSNISNDQVLRLAYSSALMRFVNHMLDGDTARGSSLYAAARGAGVPDWIVDLRHDTAHSNTLPSLELLRHACATCLYWLRNNYWERHLKSIADYVVGQTELIGPSNSQVAALIHFCMCLSICSHNKIKKLSDITDVSMQNAIVNEARDLFGNLIDLSNLKLVSVKSLINIVFANGRNMLKSKDTTTIVNQTLLGEESLFLSLELLEYLSKNDFNNKQTLNRNYIMCFEVLLSFLHSNDLLYDFVTALVKITQSEECPKKSMLAALWLSEILSALRKSKQFLEKVNKTDSAMPSKKRDLKTLYHHWFPNEKLDSLILDLQQPVPSKLTDINTIQPIITSYNQYLTYFIRDLLHLLDPHLPKQVTEKVCRLAKAVSNPEKFPVQCSLERIYTVDDLKTKDTAMHIENRGIESNVTDLSYNVTGIWKIAADHNWARCPIGKVPWDQNYPIEMEYDS